MEVYGHVLVFPVLLFLDLDFDLLLVLDRDFVHLVLVDFDLLFVFVFDLLLVFVFDLLLVFDFGPFFVFDFDLPVFFVFVVVQSSSRLDRVPVVDPMVLLMARSLY